jgi:hypothetical protein
MGGWYNPAGCLTARLLKIQVQLSVSLPFSCWNRDALLGIRIRDGEMLVAVSKVFGDAFSEGVVVFTDRLDQQGKGVKAFTLSRVQVL